MNRSLPEVISDILTYNGSVTEMTNDGFMELILTPHVSNILGLPEYTRMSFTAVEDVDVIYGSYGSDFLDSLSRLFEGKGRFSIARFPSSILNVEKLMKVVNERVTFSNATFRIEGTEVKDVSYLLIHFRYTALSDEKREGILPLLINETNLSVTILETNVITELTEDKERGDTSLSLQKALQAAYTACSQMVRERENDFIKSLERRLNRDIKRIYEYYSAMREETVKVIKQNLLESMMATQQMTLAKAMVEVEKIINEDRLGSLAEEKTDKLIKKLKAIDTEKKWKVQDLIGKYAMNILIEPISIVRIYVETLIFWIDIKRRLASRRFPVTYNPVTRHLDLMPCESCFVPQRPHYVCDDNLHIICNNCFKVCSDCDKRYCSICHKEGCPRCMKHKKKENESLTSQKCR